MKTSTQYQLQQKKKNKLYFPNIKKLNINLYSDVSEKAKVKGENLHTCKFSISLCCVSVKFSMQFLVDFAFVLINTSTVLNPSHVQWPAPGNPH